MAAVEESYENFWYSQFANQMDSALHLEERIMVYEMYDEILDAFDPGETWSTVGLAFLALKNGRKMCAIKRGAK